MYLLLALLAFSLQLTLKYPIHESHGIYSINLEIFGTEHKMALSLNTDGLYLYSNLYIPEGIDCETLDSCSKDIIPKIVEGERVDVKEVIVDLYIGNTTVKMPAFIIVGGWKRAIESDGFFGLSNDHSNGNDIMTILKEYFVDDKITIDSKSKYLYIGEIQSGSMDTIYSFNTTDNWALIPDKVILSNVVLDVEKIEFHNSLDGCIPQDAFNYFQKKSTGCTLSEQYGYICATLFMNTYDMINDFYVYKENNYFNISGKMKLSDTYISNFIFNYTLCEGHMVMPLYNILFKNIMMLDYSTDILMIGKESASSLWLLYLFGVIFVIFVILATIFASKHKKKRDAIDVFDQS